jgi:tetratricopeptide (TPR) repeat protein
MKLIYFICVLLLHAFILPAQEKHEQAGTQEKKATVLSPNKAAVARYREGNRFLESGDYKNAVSSFRMALRNDSTFIAAIDSLARCYRMTGLLDSAEIFYTRSVTIRPKNLPAMANLAAVYIQKNELNRAEETYRKIIRTDPRDPDGYFGLAEIMLKTGRPEQATTNALKAYDLWKTVNPAYAGDALFYAGLGYLSGEDRVNARKYFEKARKLGATIPVEYLEKAGIKQAE